MIQQLGWCYRCNTSWFHHSPISSESRMFLMISSPSAMETRRSFWQFQDISRIRNTRLDEPVRSGSSFSLKEVSKSSLFIELLDAFGQALCWCFSWTFWSKLLQNPASCPASCKRSTQGPYKNGPFSVAEGWTYFWIQVSQRSKFWVGNPENENIYIELVAKYLSSKIICIFFFQLY